MPITTSQKYEFSYCEMLKSNDPNHYFKAVHVYKFKAGENNYLVTFEEYRYDIYIPQFCLENQMDSANKFNLLANIGFEKAKKVIATCIHIGLSIYYKNPNASFLFTASPTMDELHTGNVANNKRFSVFNYFIDVLIHKDYFTQSRSGVKNSYLLLNKNFEKQEPNALKKINEMFESLP